MSESRRPDRRIERTMTALRDALMSLIIEKGYDAISIQDIADRANVARATFYLHFRDKDDLMFKSMRVIYDGMFARHPQDLTVEALADDSDFQHIAQYADFYAAMLSAKGSMGFLARVRAYLQEELEKSMYQLIPPDVTPRLPRPLIAAYCTGAQIGLIWWWVENRLPIPAEKMALYTMQLSVFGLNWALGGELVSPDQFPQITESEK
jgi:AcrR family transcriptional regulator